MKPFGKTARIAWSLGGFIVLGAATVVACGPDFPLQLLDDRAGTLRNTPANSFGWEVARLVKPTDALRADEGSGDVYPALPENDPRSLQMKEKGSLDAAQFEALKAMRAQPDGAAAYAVGAALPAAVRLYTAGAQHYRAAFGADGMTLLPAPLARAQERFEKVLALPAAQASERAVWAAYMLGRVHALRGERQQAVAAFEQTRQLALAGAPDPLGLAVDSYGEQARLYLKGQERICGWADFNELRRCPAGIEVGDLKQAIRLYAEQAARGSLGARSSLQAIAAWSLSHGDTSAALIDEPVAQRLLVAYALAYVGDRPEGPPVGGSIYDPHAPTSGMSGYADAARGGGLKPNMALVNLVEALQRRGLQDIDGIDRVAALAYRTSRYALAAELAQRHYSALAWWVRAKLALQRGDLQAATQAYAHAVPAFPRNDGSVEPANADLVQAEHGVLKLSRGQIVEALAQFHQACLQSAARAGVDGYVHPDFSSYYNDLAYLAERVLTLEELLTYVDTQAPASPMPAPAQVIRKARQEDGVQRLRLAALRLSPPTVADQLRLLLARRLVRAGRVEQALAYFPDERDERFVQYLSDDNGKDSGNGGGRTWRLRSKAREYGQALERARHAWFASSRAQGWYEAALIARRQGMEIMGFEQAPDFAVYGGAFDGGAGRSDNWERGPLVTDSERQRYAASAARPNQRFHYRDIAADYVMKAADALPARSQAFAAVLCQGVNFVHTDEQRASQLYRRYLSQGAAVAFARDFGRQCEEPDFAAAARWPYVQQWRRLRHWLGPHRVAAMGALLVLALGAGWWLQHGWRQRRRRRQGGV